MRGRLDDTDLVLGREIGAPVAQVWADVTDPERTARWFGPWEGDGAPGNEIRVRMVFEEGAPEVALRIDACEPPHRLTVTQVDGGWQMSLLLTGTDGGTEVRLVHHLETTEGIGEIGPGWEYYLDLLVAARNGTARPEFADYYPAMKPYYESLRG